MSHSEVKRIIRRLRRCVSELEEMFPDRPFTLDGHLVGSLGECYAADLYGLKLNKPGNKGFDAWKGKIQVEIKTTQRNSIALREEPEHLLVFQMQDNGTFTEVYNGPGAPVWSLVAHRKRPSNGQYQVSLNRLKKLMEEIPVSRKLKPLGADDQGNPSV